MQQRDYVIPEDVRATMMDVFSHRLILNSRAKLNEYTPEQILEEIAGEVKIAAPKEMVFLER